MPIATLQILEGRNTEQIERLIDNVTRAISESLGAPPETVRVLVVELPKTHWGVGGQTLHKRGR